MNDVWVCDTCKSINRARDDRCYRCAGRRENALAETGPEVRVANAVASRATRGYVPSWPAAAVVGAMILAVAALGIYLLVLQVSGLAAVRQAFLDSFRTGMATGLEPLVAQEAELAGPSALRTLLILASVVGFGVWLAMVRLNIPTLGGGEPSWGPWKALLYPIIPIVNIIKVPGMLNDALYRLDSRAGGFFMILAAWIGFFGSWLVGIAGTAVITGIAVQGLIAAPSFEDGVAVFGQMVDQVYLLSAITETMIAVGAVLLVVVMGRIERRAAARNAEIRAAVLVPEGPA